MIRNICDNTNSLYIAAGNSDLIKGVDRESMCTYCYLCNSLDGRCDTSSFICGIFYLWLQDTINHKLGRFAPWNFEITSKLLAVIDPIANWCRSSFGRFL